MLSFAARWIPAVLVPLAYAQPAWQPADGPVAGTYQSESGALAYVLTLVEADALTGYDLSDLHEDFAEEVLSYVLWELDIDILEQEQDLSTLRRASVWGPADTPDGRREVAAGLRMRGSERVVVVIQGDARAFASVGGRDALDADFPSSDSGGRAARQRVVIAEPQRTATPADPSAPRSWDDLAQWTERGGWHVETAGDAGSPRWGSARLGFSDASNTDEAVPVILDRLGIETRSDIAIETLEVWRQMGARRSAALVETRLGGVRGIAFVIAQWKVNELGYTGLVIEMSMDTFVAWGGVTRLLALRGVTPSATVFPEDRVGEIARSSFSSQLDIYEAAGDALYAELAEAARQTSRGPSSLSEAAVTLRLMELNYDLLLGGDISSPFIAD
ncbi:MAG: hypothetical protein AAGK21_07075 [Bacteroidota bacterium]